MPLPYSTARTGAATLAKKGTTERFDRIVRLAPAIFGTPFAALNLIGRDAQYTVSSQGCHRSRRLRSRSPSACTPCARTTSSRCVT